MNSREKAKMAMYKDVLNRVPDDIILSIASRHIIPEDGNACLCGWVVREAVGGLVNEDPLHLRTTDDRVNEIVTSSSQYGKEPKQCQTLYGGKTRHWNTLYQDIAFVSRMPLVELAFVNRVKKAAKC